MKTTIKSFIIICILGLAGVTNTNASVNGGPLYPEFGRVAQTVSGVTEKMNLFEAGLNESIDYQKEAQLVTRWIADLAEAKVTHQVFDVNEEVTGESGTSENELAVVNNDETTDFRTEAQLITKAIADKEEAVVIQKLMELGKIAEK